jgi:hypothetical protein
VNNPVLSGIIHELKACAEKLDHIGHNLPEDWKREWRDCLDAAGLCASGAAKVEKLECALHFRSMRSAEMAHHASASNGPVSGQGGKVA